LCKIQLYLEAPFPCKINIAMGKAARKKGKTFTLYPFPFSLTKRYIVRFNCANLLKRGGFAWHQTKNIFCKSMIVGYLEPQMDTDGHR
jgi:hypothetical protein